MTWLRRSPRACDAVCLLLLALLALGLLWPVTVRGQVLLTTPVMLDYDPWYAHRSEFSELRHQRWYPLLDPVDQILPGCTFIGEQFRRDVLPLWSPRQYCGSPFLALGPSALLYPESWLYLLPNPEKVLSWSAVLFLFLAGAAMFAFLRTLGCRRAAALLGAVGFLTNGFFVAWLNWPAMRAVFLWLPVILLGYERAVRGRSLPWALFGALAVGLHFLDGFLQMSIYLLLVVGLYGLARTALAARRGGLRAARWPLLALVIVLALGLALSAGQLLPTLELGGSSLRFNTYEQQLDYGIPPYMLLSGFFPALFGHPADDLFWGEFMPAQHRAFSEVTWGLSGSIWLFALLALLLRRRPATWFWVGIAVFGALLALNRGADALLYFTVPGFAKLNAITRALVIPATAVPVLAAFGLDALLAPLASGEERHRRLVAVLGAGVALLLIGLAAMTTVRLVLPTTRFYALVPELSGYADHQVHKCLLAVALAVGLGALCLGPRRRLALAGLLLLAAGEGYFFLHHYSPTGDARYLHIQTATIPALQGGDQPHRFLSVGDNWAHRLPPNHAMGLDLEDLQGYLSLVPARTQSLLNAISNTDLGLLQPDWRLPALDVLNVRDVISRQALPSLPKYAELPGAYEVHLYRNREVLPRAYVPPRVRVVAGPAQVLAQVAGPGFRPHEEALVETPLPGSRQESAPLLIADYDINSFTIAGEQPWRGLTVVSLGYGPGWHARADGRHELRVRPVDYALTGLEVGPEPAQWVQVFYYPATFAVGFFVACLASAALLAVWVFSRRPR